MTTQELKIPNLEQSLTKNRFIVRFHPETEISEFCVYSFKKPSYNFLKRDWVSKTIKIGLNFYFHEEGKWYETMDDFEIIENFKQINKIKDNYIVFEELDRTGVVVNSYIYQDIRIAFIDFDENIYDIDPNDTVRSCKLTVTFGKCEKSKK